MIQDRASALRANNPEKPDSWRPGKINDVSARRRLRPCKIYLCITDTSTNDYVHTDAAVSQDGARLFLQRENTRHFGALTLNSVCETDFETRSNALANIKGPFRMTRCESKPFLHLEGEKHGRWFSAETFENGWNDANLLFSFGLIMHKGTTNEFSESVSRISFEYFISDKSTISQLWRMVHRVEVTFRYFYYYSLWILRLDYWRVCFVSERVLKRSNNLWKLICLISLRNWRELKLGKENFMV